MYIDPEEFPPPLSLSLSLSLSVCLAYIHTGSTYRADAFLIAAGGRPKQRIFINLAPSTERADCGGETRDGAGERYSRNVPDARQGAGSEHVG